MLGNNSLDCLVKELPHHYYMQRLKINTQVINLIKLISSLPTLGRVSAILCLTFFWAEKLLFKQTIYNSVLQLDSILLWNYIFVIAISSLALSIAIVVRICLFKITGEPNTEQEYPSPSKSLEGDNEEFTAKDLLSDLYCLVSWTDCCQAAITQCYMMTSVNYIQSNNERYQKQKHSMCFFQNNFVTAQLTWPQTTSRIIFESIYHFEDTVEYRKEKIAINKPINSTTLYNVQKRIQGKQYFGGKNYAKLLKILQRKKSRIKIIAIQNSSPLFKNNQLLYMVHTTDTSSDRSHLPYYLKHIQTDNRVGTIGTVVSSCNVNALSHLSSKKLKSHKIIYTESISGTNQHLALQSSSDVNKIRTYESSSNLQKLPVSKNKLHEAETHVTKYNSFSTSVTDLHQQFRVKLMKSENHHNTESSFTSENHPTKYLKWSRRLNKTDTMAGSSSKSRAIFHSPQQIRNNQQIYMMHITESSSSTGAEKDYSVTKISSSDNIEWPEIFGYEEEEEEETEEGEDLFNEKIQRLSKNMGYIWDTVKKGTKTTAAMSAKALGTTRDIINEQKEKYQIRKKKKKKKSKVGTAQTLKEIIVLDAVTDTSAPPNPSDTPEVPVDVPENPPPKPIERIKVDKKIRHISNDVAWINRHYERIIGRFPRNDLEAVLATLERQKRYFVCERKVYRGPMAGLHGTGAVNVSWEDCPKVSTCACPFDYCLCEGNKMHKGKKIPCGQCDRTIFGRIGRALCNRPAETFIPRLLKALEMERKRYEKLAAKGELDTAQPEFCLTGCYAYYRKNKRLEALKETLGEKIPSDDEEGIDPEDRTRRQKIQGKDDDKGIDDGEINEGKSKKLSRDSRGSLKSENKRKSHESNESDEDEKAGKKKKRKSSKESVKGKNKNKGKSKKKKSVVDSEESEEEEPVSKKSKRKKSKSPSAKSKKAKGKKGKAEESDDEDEDEKPKSKKTKSKRKQSKLTEDEEEDDDDVKSKRKKSKSKKKKGRKDSEDEESEDEERKPKSKTKKKQSKTNEKEAKGKAKKKQDEDEEEPEEEPTGKKAKDKKGDKKLLKGKDSKVDDKNKKMSTAKSEFEEDNLDAATLKSRKSAITLKSRKSNAVSEFDALTLKSKDSDITQADAVTLKSRISDEQDAKKVDPEQKDLKSTEPTPSVGVSADVTELLPAGQIPQDANLPTSGDVPAPLDLPPTGEPDSLTAPKVVSEPVPMAKLPKAKGELVKKVPARDGAPPVISKEPCRGILLDIKGKKLVCKPKPPEKIRCRPEKPKTDIKSSDTEVEGNKKQSCRPKVQKCQGIVYQNSGSEAEKIKCAPKTPKKEQIPKSETDTAIGTSSDEAKEENIILSTTKQACRPKLQKCQGIVDQNPGLEAGKKKCAPKIPKIKENPNSETETAIGTSSDEVKEENITASDEAIKMVTTESYPGFSNDMYNSQGNTTDSTLNPPPISKQTKPVTTLTESRETIVAYSSENLQFSDSMVSLRKQHRIREIPKGRRNRLNLLNVNIRSESSDSDKHIEKVKKSSTNKKFASKSDLTNEDVKGTHKYADNKKEKSSLRSAENNKQSTQIKYKSDKTTKAKTSNLRKSQFKSKSSESEKVMDKPSEISCESDRKHRNKNHKYFHTNTKKQKLETSESDKSMKEKHKFLHDKTNFKSESSKLEKHSREKHKFLKEKMSKHSSESLKPDTTREKNKSKNIKKKLSKSESSESNKHLRNKHRLLNQKSESLSESPESDSTEKHKSFNVNKMISKSEGLDTKNHMREKRKSLNEKKSLSRSETPDSDKAIREKNKYLKVNKSKSRSESSESERPLREKYKSMNIKKSNFSSESVESDSFIKENYKLLAVKKTRSSSESSESDEPLREKHKSFKVKRTSSRSESPESDKLSSKKHKPSKVKKSVSRLESAESDKPTKEKYIYLNVKKNKPASKGSGLNDQPFKEKRKSLNTNKVKTRSESSESNKSFKGKRNFFNRKKSASRIESSESNKSRKKKSETIKKVKAPIKKNFIDSEEAVIPSDLDVIEDDTKHRQTRWPKQAKCKGRKTNVEGPDYLQSSISAAPFDKSIEKQKKKGKPITPVSSETTNHLISSLEITDTSKESIAVPESESVVTASSQVEAAVKSSKSDTTIVAYSSDILQPTESMVFTKQKEINESNKHRKSFKHDDKDKYKDSFSSENINKEKNKTKKKIKIGSESSEKLKNVNTHNHKSSKSTEISETEDTGDQSGIQSGEDPAISYDEHAIKCRGCGRKKRRGKLPMSQPKMQEYSSTVLYTSINKSTVLPNISGDKMQISAYRNPKLCRGRKRDPSISGFDIITTAKNIYKKLSAKASASRTTTSSRSRSIQIKADNQELKNFIAVESTYKPLRVSFIDE